MVLEPKGKIAVQVYDKYILVFACFFLKNYLLFADMQLYRCPEEFKQVNSTILCMLTQK